LFSLYLAPPNNAGPCGHHRVQGVPVQVCRYLYRYLWSNLGARGYLSIYNIQNYLKHS
jgi:hypothetical protein